MKQLLVLGAKKTLSDALSSALRYVFALYVMALANDMSEVRGALLPEDAGVLPDVMFDLLPYTPELGKCIDMILIGLYAVVVAWSATFERRFDLICAFVDMHVLMILLRCLTVNATTLPASLPDCARQFVARNVKPYPLFINPLLRFAPGGMSMGCHDLIFSGHTVVYTLASLFMYDVARDYRLLRLATHLLSLTGVVCLLASKMHYSIDVVVAVIIMFLVYLQWRPTVLALVNEERRLLLPLSSVAAE
jgi:hypothetical protein